MDIYLIEEDIDDKQVTTCLMTYVIRAMQINTTIGSLYTPFGIAEIQNTDQMLVRVHGNKGSHSLLMGLQNGATILEDSLTASHKGKHNLTTCLFLGIYPFELKTHPHKNLYKRLY